MTVNEYAWLVPRYQDLPTKVRAALNPYIAGARILEVSTGRAHSLIETSFSYLRDEALHQVVYDKTTRKVCGVRMAQSKALNRFRHRRPSGTTTKRPPRERLRSRLITTNPLPIRSKP